MKIHLSIEENKKVQLLLKRQDKNIEAAEAINSYLDHKSDSTFVKAEQESKKEDGKDAFMRSFLSLSGADKPLAEEYKLHGTLLDPFPYLLDPYIKNIHFRDEKLRGWTLGASEYKPFEGFMYDELIIEPKNDYKEITPFGYFSKPFPFLEVKENGVTWMSLTPHEINTMKDAVKEARGRVLTFGLGLGYYVYLASLKDEVSEVVCVEKDPNIIALFKRFILPQFSTKAKVTIIEEDAFKYARKMKDGQFDYVFVDIWHLPTDGLDLYLQFKKIFSSYSLTPINYWVETSLLTLLRRAILILFDEESQGSTDEDYDYAATSSDILINTLHKKLKKVEIRSYSDLIGFLSDDNLKKLIV